MTKTKTNHKCERCGKESQYREICNQCERKVCQACIKNSKRVGANDRMVICKDCWGKADKKKAHKRA